MAESYYATMLAEDEQERREGTGSEPVYQKIAKQLDAAGVEYETPFVIGPLPEFGMSDRELIKQINLVDWLLPASSAALAKGDITIIREQLDELLYAFQLDLDRKSASYRKLGMAVLTAHVRALKDMERRNAGDPIETPELAYLLGAPMTQEGGTLRDAFEGWKKERERPEGTVHEYNRAIEMFIQLHGNLKIVEMKRSHARTFREDLQAVPRFRKGALLKASLPELAEYGRKHPEATKVSSGTVNMQLGAVQAVARWGRGAGLVAEDAPWSDPFEEMRLEEEQSEREPFDARDLQAIFNAPLFTEHKLPVGAKGDAGIWLPLLALYHSFRHGFQDALRKATPDEELRDAITGRSSGGRGGKSVGRTYGAKEMLRRWGVASLKDAIDKVEYPGLDLSHVRPLNTPTTTRGNKRK